MKRSGLRRALSVLLCLSILLGLLPGAAFALDDEGLEAEHTAALDNPPADDVDDESDGVLDEDPSTEPEQVAAPVIEADGADVTITCDTEDAQIYYTIDGDEPSESSIEYHGSFTLEETATVKAIAIKEGMTGSEVAAEEIAVESDGIMPIDLSGASHLDPLTYTLIDGGLGDESKWETSSNGPFTFDPDTDSVKIVGSGPNNAITYNGGKLQTADFLIQLDITPPANTTDADDFKVRMKEDADGNRLQVMFKFKEKFVALEKVNSEEPNQTQWGGTSDASYSTAFTWEPGTTYPVDILVQGDTVSVYWNGDKLLEKSHNDVDAMTPSALSLASQYPNQNHTISNLKVTSDTNPDSEPTRVATPVIEADGADVTITCETDGAEIYYTIDESDPDKESGTKYTDPFTLDATATVKAIAVKDGLIDSAVSSKTITVANANVIHKFDPLDRVLLPESALNNDESWDISLANTTSSITIANGEAHLVTGGTNNRMGYNMGRINASDFLIRFDYTVNVGATPNTNTKIAFKCTDQYEGDRLQVRLNPVQNQISIERGTSATAAGDGAWSSELKSFNWEVGHTYGIDIQVSGNEITVYVDGQEAVSTTQEDISTMAKGYFAISTQFPTGDVTIKNLSITTDEEQTGNQYTVTLKTATDGSIDAAPAGGTLTADTLTGYAGDLITLTAEPAHGYVLEKFTSYKADGSSTDGLMPINNGTFTLDDKFGNVTVIAHFIKRVPGKFELFYDDFAGDSWDSRYEILDEEKISQNHVLTIDASNTNYILLKDSVFTPKQDGEGLRISVDAWKADSTSGTMQIMFKGTFDDRYVLVINGSEAVFRHIAATNEKLATASFSFSTTKASLVLEVEGDTAVFYANGKEILRYTSEDSWGGAEDTAGLVNMTPNAPVCFDNFLVERIPSPIAVNVETYLLSGGEEVPDTNHIAGSAAASSSSIVEGDEVIMTATTKVGYSLREYKVTDGDGVAIAVEDSRFTVPQGVVGPITVKAVFETSGVRTARSFYIDSENGSDSGDGTIDSPWKSLDKLASYTQADALVPGDQVLLKRGSVFNSQQLRFSGMGSKSAPVIISAYGDGSALPRLNGEGNLENVVSLYNQEYITISNLEITNTDPAFNSDFNLNSSNNSTKALRAINVSAKDFGVVSGIYIQNCYIHDINGNITAKWNGGIFFDVQVTVDTSTFTLTGVPTKYDDVLIEGCTFRNVDRSGIKLVSSGWCNQWLPNDTAKPINWYPSTHVVVRNNYLENIGGDGITTRDTDGALIEYNLVKDCRYQNTGYNVGIWPFQAASTVIQYNEAYNTHSTTDGQGLDCDHASSYSLMQYNYSHNNEGGFMLIMGGYPHTAATVRYNISQNDLDKTFEFAQGIPMGTMIYNNTIYSKDLVGRGVLFLSNTANGRGINDMYLFNNLFIYPAGQTFYGGSQTSDLKTHAKLYNNGYVGLTAPDEESEPITASNVADVLMNAGSGPETNSTEIPVTGKSGVLDGYQLAEDSPMLDKGVTISEAIAYFGGEGFQVFDGRKLSPSELETQYYGKGEKSLKYVMGQNFPQISGVDYTADFFGNPDVQNDKPDIGAAEKLDHEHTGGTANCASGAICEICGKAYGNVDPNHHTGNTEVRGAYAATATQAGYTGDTYCADCGVLLESGETIPATDPDHTKHSGGTATCISGAICEICGAEYGDVDPNHHTGNTEVRGAYAATATEAGYTGDTYCKDCGALLERGKAIPAAGSDHLDHTGGTATCVSKAICEICGKAYGNVDPNHHTGDTEVRNAYPATATEAGYTGDTYCTDCGALLVSGKTIPAGHLEHSGGTATCVSQAVCEICDVAYGDIDPNHHTGNTEVRGAYAATATEAGYTGDTYCADCGALLESGRTIPATGSSQPGGSTGSISGTGTSGNTGNTGSSGGTGASGSTDSALPVKTDGTGNSTVTTTTTATVPASTSNGTASVTITAEIANEIIRQIEDNRSEEVVIAPVASGNVSKMEVTISASFVNTLSSKTDVPLIVETPAAKITIQNQSLANLGASASTITITVDQTGQNTVDVAVAKDGKRLDTINGGLKAEISMARASSGTVAILVAADGAETIIKKAVAVDGIFNLMLDGSATVKFKDNSKNFSDIGSHWAKEAIDFVSSRDLFSGVSEDRFAANETMSRAMLVTVLYRLEDMPASSKVSFSDVEQGKWYSDAVSWAASNGITTGSGSGFNPDGSVSREQLAAFLYRYAQMIGVDVTARSSIDGYSDGNMVSSWAGPAMQWAVGEGIITGRSSSQLDPGGSATRAETATILMRFYKSIALAT